MACVRPDPAAGAIWLLYRKSPAFAGLDGPYPIAWQETSVSSDRSGGVLRLGARLG